jgi:enoyl-CoA hydratase
LIRTQDLLIDPSRGWPGAAEPWSALGFIDLSACARDMRIDALPPYPLIGVGDPTHPLADILDAIVEPPISAEALIRQTSQAPHAGSVAVQLLRSVEHLAPERALPLESFCYGLLQGSAEHLAWLAARVPAAQRRRPARPAPPAPPAPLEPPAPPGRVRIDRRGSELLITLDRPAARNAIDRAMRDQLFDAATIAALDTQITAIKLRAMGTCFSVGADLTEFGTTRDPATAHLIRSRTLPANALCLRAASLDVHVQGACVGAGLEMAAFAGRLTATPDAWFQLPELAMGLIPGAGGCVSVPRRIGRQRTTLMILSGRRINAATALRWGLIDAIEVGAR